MDGDPAVDPVVDPQQLDSFSVAFPLPYRIAVIVILGARFCPPRCPPRANYPSMLT